MEILLLGHKVIFTVKKKGEGSEKPSRIYITESEMLFTHPHDGALLPPTTRSLFHSSKSEIFFILQSYVLVFNGNLIESKSY